MGNCCFRVEDSLPSVLQHQKESIIEYPNGDKYSGGNPLSPALNAVGHREGHGIYYFANNDRYDGLWVADKKEGQGTFYYANGEAYKGDW